jgi:C-terminal processing protease CtpA/Prc
VWRGPLIVLTDGETWSAAEELPATLQDNKAAVILGGRTGGAGCGHASGAEPITLKNSGGKLVLPDCVRFRFDGSNEVAGVIPDVQTGHRFDDSDAMKAKLIAAKLPEAIALARTLQP